MPYIKRNPEGAITSISDEAAAGYSELLALSHPDMQAFLSAARAQLSSSDSETIRVIEDLVELLIRKKVILLTDLPEAAQQKLSVRQRMRDEINVLSNLMVGEEDIL